MMNSTGNIMATVTEYYGLTEEQWNNMPDDKKTIKINQYLYEQQFGTSLPSLNSLTDAGIIQPEPLRTPQTYKQQIQNFITMSKPYASIISVIDNIKNKNNKNKNENTNVNTSVTSQAVVPPSIPSIENTHAATPNSINDANIDIEDENDSKMKILETTDRNNESALNATPTQHNTHSNPMSLTEHLQSLTHSKTRNLRNERPDNFDLDKFIMSCRRDGQIIPGTAAANYNGLHDKHKTPDSESEDMDITPSAKHAASVREKTPIDTAVTTFLEKSDGESEFEYFELGDTEANAVKRRKTGALSSITTRKKSIFDKTKGKRKNPKAKEVPGGDNENKNTGNRNENTGQKGQDDNGNTQENSSDNHSTHEDDNDNSNENNNNNNNNNNRDNRDPGDGQGGNQGGGDKGNGDEKKDDEEKDENKNNDNEDEDNQKQDDEENDQQEHQPQNVAGNGGGDPHHSDDEDNDNSSEISSTMPDPEADADGARRKMNRLMRKYRKQKDNARPAGPEAPASAPQVVPNPNIQGQIGDMMKDVTTVFTNNLKNIVDTFTKSNQKNDFSYDERLSYDQTKRERGKNLDNKIDLYIKQNQAFNGENQLAIGEFFFKFVKFANDLETITKPSTFHLFRSTVTSKFSKLAKKEWQKVKTDEQKTYDQFIKWYSDTFLLGNCLSIWYEKLKRWKSTHKVNETWDSIKNDFNELCQEYHVLYHCANDVMKKKYHFTPDQIPCLFYDGVKRGAGKRVKYLDRWIFNNNLNIQDYNWKQFVKKVLTPLREREILAYTLDETQRADKTKKKQNLDYGKQINAISYQPQGGRNRYGNRNRNKYGQRPHKRPHKRSNYNGKGNYYTSRHQRPKGRGSGKGKPFGRGKRHGKGHGKGYGRGQGKGRDFNHKKYNYCKSPSGERFNPKKHGDAIIIQWVKNNDLEALICFGQCRRCQYYGHWAKECKHLNRNMKEKLQRLYNYKRSKLNNTINKNRNKDATRHANVAQNTNQTNQSQSNHSQSNGQQDNNSNQSQSGQANILLKDTNAQSINAAQKEDSPHINVVHTTSDNEAHAQTNPRANKSSSNINVSEVSREINSILSSKLRSIFSSDNNNNSNQA